MANDHYGGGDLYEEGNASETPMTKLQIFMGRSIGGWPLYTIIISLGQLLSAVSDVRTGSGVNSYQDIDVVPAQSALRVQHDNADRPVHHLLDLRGCHFGLVHPLQDEAFRLCPQSTVAYVSQRLDPMHNLTKFSFAVAFTLIGFPSLHGIFTPPRKTITRVATWCTSIEAFCVPC